MHDPSYLLSVVETLADSAPSPHDLLDAYTTFASRVRSHSHLLETCDTLLPALAPLKVHGDAFIRALRRDVRLAHVDPLSALSHPHSSLGDTWHVSVDAKQHARDSSALCHHALCAITTIFRFPAFRFVFTEHDLSILFGDVLDIALAEKLPVLNEAKTYSLSLWSLGSHRLPPTVLGSRRHDVVSALHRCLDGARQPDSSVLDGLKAVSHVLEHHSSAFFNLLFPLLPHVMKNLHRESSELRLHASIALGKFANALIHQTNLSFTKWQTLSDHITSYLESCCDQSQVAQGDTTFSHIVRAAFSPESHTSPSVAPTSILAVLASLIVLCGPALYRKHAVLRFILQTLAMALTHKRSIVRALHPHVWRCFVWTFSQMLISSEDVDPALISSAFYVIRQEVSGGIGMALANILLSDRITEIRSDSRSDRVSQALLVIEAMIRTECKHTRREAFMFLQAFTNVAQARHQILQDMHEIPASVLLDGAIIGAKWGNLPSIIRSIPKVPVSVHWLENAEVARQYKILLEIWKHYATKIDRKDLDSGFVDVWLSILLACSHQLECGQHVAATADVLRHTAAVIVNFLPPVALADNQPNWGSWNVHDQLYSLTFIDQLWSAMRRAFVSLSLAEAAELILASVLKYGFHILDVGVRSVWGRLCANLMTTASPSFLREVNDPTASQLVIRSQRELWGVIATSLCPPELGLHWRELVSFLAFPICTWGLSKPELEAWEALLRNAITVSGDSAMVIDYFVLEYLQGKGVETWESIIPVLGFLLTHTHEHGNSPTDNLLSVVDVCLTVSYSRAGHSPGELTHSLELLNVIRHVIVSAPGKAMHVLQVLCSSLCLWIEDHTEIMSDDEFNSVAVSLYCEALKSLKVLPLSIQFLQDMEIFIASAFSRIPTPAIAPFAFEKFWRATYHGHSQFYSILPSKIKACLACFVAAYGGDLADGLSLTTESQSQSINNDSQVHFPTGSRHQDSEVPDMQVAPHGHPEMDTTFPIPTFGDDVPQPTVLRRLQEYSSRIDAPSPDGSEQSMRHSQIRLSPISPHGDAITSSHSPKKVHSVTSYALHRKWTFADSDGAPQKRSRTSRGIFLSVRKSVSEPATRDVTPIKVPRMTSVPLKKRKVFDGVQVPTLRGVSRQKIVRKAGTNKNVLNTEQGLVSVPRTPSSSSARGKKRTSPSVGSDEDDLDWENFRVDATSSEVDIDQSLMDIYPGSPQQTPSSASHEGDDESYLPSGLTLPKAVSQNEGPSSASTRPSPQRAKTTSARLDALRDVYASIENGASQIPMSELVQATKLVHQIGAVLTEQMGKKMDGPR